MESLIFGLLGGIIGGGLVTAVRWWWERASLEDPLEAPASSVPCEHDEHQHELLYLKDGVYVSYDPPKFALPGEHPTAAAWRCFHETGINHSSRRLGD